jgi:signal peptidase I
MAKKQERKYGRAGSGSKDAGGSSKPRGDGPNPGNQGSELKEWLKSLAVAFVLFMVLRTFILGTFVITSGSMEETLLVGDFLVVNRLAIGSKVPGTDVRIPGYGEPHRGDVLVFDPPHEEDLKLVKRLIGLPGDTLEMRGKTLFRNGQELEEPYLKFEDVPGQGDDYHPWMEWQKDHLAPGVDARSYRPSRDNWGPIVIPERSYFMLGDNRDSSLDSRYWGLLDDWRLEARAVFIYFSFEKESTRPFAWLREVRWGRLGDRIR